MEVEFQKGGIYQYFGVPAEVRVGIFDARVYTLSPGNVAFLRDIGAWQSIPLERVTAVHAMRVFGESRLYHEAIGQPSTGLTMGEVDSRVASLLKGDA